MSLIGSFYNEKESFLKSSSEEIKKELLFEFDDFQKPLYSENLKTVANLVHSLLFLKKGTYPDAPEMGIDIEQFMFEPMTEETFEKIKKEINDQMDMYLPSLLIRDLVVKNVSNENNKSILGIGFDISYNEAREQEQFFVIVSDDIETRTLLSEIVY